VIYENNRGLGPVSDLWLVVINQNGGFTKVWLSLKTIFFPMVVGVMIWFWRRVQLLARQPTLLESMLLALGVALSTLNRNFIRSFIKDVFSDSSVILLQFPLST
jgi:hypothetical protein